VYGITRRGFGASSAPAPSGVGTYSADRLGDDVLAVMEVLKIDRPVLVGHSLGGEELSSIGSRHPEKVAGLVYLDAAYVYAFYDPAGAGNWVVDLPDLQRKLQQLRIGEGPRDVMPLIRELLTTTLPPVCSLHRRSFNLPQFQRFMKDTRSTRTSRCLFLLSSPSRMSRQ
jgi:non-heme chloroperoxidase